LSSITHLGASSLWDIILSYLQGPVEAEAIAESSHGQLADVVASQLQRTLAANSRLGIVGEGRKAVQLFENAQEDLVRLDALEASVPNSNKRKV
jgi:hypothetical protein